MLENLRLLTTSYYKIIKTPPLMEDDISDSVMSVLEQFVVLLCDQNSNQVSVNDARKQLFTYSNSSHR